MPKGSSGVGSQNFKSVIEDLKPTKLFVNVGMKKREEIIAQLSKLTEIYFIDVFGNRKVKPTDISVADT